MRAEFESKFFELLEAIAAMTGSKLTELIIGLYDKALSPHGYDRAYKALHEIFENMGSNSRMPTIAQIKERMGVKEISPDGLARLACARIREAVPKFGYLNEKKAIEYIGPLGEQIVKSLGGWNRLCESPTHKELDFSLTQGREFAKAIVESGGFDMDLAKHQLIESQKPRQMIGVSKEKTI